MSVEPAIAIPRPSRLEQAPWVGRRAVAVALLALLPLLALLVATGWSMREAAIEDAKAEALRLAIAASENHSQIVEGTRGLLAALAAMPVVAEGGVEERERLLRDRLDESRSLLNLGVVDSAGTIVASALPTPIPVSAAHRSWFLRARETRAFAVGDYQVGAITRQASVNVAHPIHAADGRWAGVVFAAIDLRAFAAIARSMDLPGGASLQVADAKGVILARYPDPEGWAGRNAAGRATVRAMLSVRRGVFEAPGLDGIDRLYGCAPVPSERAIVAVGLPRDKALAAANAVFSRALLSLLVAGCLSLALFWSLGRRLLLQPAAECASQVERELRSQVGDAEHRARVLQAVMDESLDPVCVSDESGRLVHWNRATEAEWGYTTERLRTLRVWDLAPEFAPEVYRAAWASALKSGTLRFQTRVRRGDGGGFPADVRVTHVRVDGEDLQCAVVRDMTEALATQQQLAEKEARLREILEHSSDLHYVHGPDHVLTYVSPRSRAFFDCEPEEALRRWTEFVTDHPLNRAGLEATRLAIETGTRQPRYELQLRTVTGRTLWVEVDETPVVENGRTVAIVGALRDVTARKRAEAERGELEAQFRHAQKLEAVGRLAGGVAHDFNNLLTAIMGHAQILASRVAADTPPHRDAEEILRAADRAAMLTRQLLTFSRREVVLPRLLDVNAVVSDLGRLLRRLVGEPVEIVIAVSAERPIVRMDPGHLEQVVMNLVVNARDAMPHGGRITVETADAEFDEAIAGEVDGLRPGSYVLIAVSDAGVGMDAATKARIFEPFFTTKGEGRGTGLGLSTVKGIVDQAGGAIHVYSDPGWGTTFKVYIPRATGTVEQRAETDSLAGAPQGAESVLIVEDQDEVAAVLRATLELCGYRVLEARHGIDARRIIEDRWERIDLLVTDVVLPMMDGPSLVARARAARPGVPVLYISGYTERAFTYHQQQPAGEGASFLQKPFTPGTFARKVREVLDRALAPPV